MASQQSLPPVALIGIGIDVSRSMKGSFDNRSGSDISRLAEFRRALAGAMERARSRAKDLARSNTEGRARSKIKGRADHRDPAERDCLVFAYAFGLTEGSGIIDLFGMLDDRKVLNVLAVAGAIEAVVTPKRIKKLKDQFAQELSARTKKHLPASPWIEAVGPALSAFMELKRALGHDNDVFDKMDDARKKIAAQIVRLQIVQELASETRKRLEAEGIHDDPLPLLERLSAHVEEKVKAEEWDQVGRVIRDGLKGTIWEAIRSVPDDTKTLTDLAQRWAETERFFDGSNVFLFGKTPMCECLKLIANRFEHEMLSLPAETPKFLILVTDGEPTDGDIRPAVSRIKSLGVRIASCFVTNGDLVETRHLYAQPPAGWSEPAQLMFESSSTIDDDRLFGELLGARLDNLCCARMFTQINHSEIMEEFLSSALSRTEAP